MGLDLSLLRASMFCQLWHEDAVDCLVRRKSAARMQWHEEQVPYSDVHLSGEHYLIVEIVDCHFRIQNSNGLDEDKNLFKKMYKCKYYGVRLKSSKALY